MFEVVECGHRRRLDVEQTIRDAYLRGFGARLGDLPRVLVADIDDDAIRCAAALRFASDGFLSECYLDAPIEEVVARRTGIRPDRRSVAEVGSLAASRRGSAGDLIVEIVEFLRSGGSRWAFFTATVRLRALLARGGFPLIDLGPADASRIGNADAWGSYYRAAPRVMLVGDAMLGPAAARHATAAAVEHA